MLNNEAGTATYYVTDQIDYTAQETKLDPATLAVDEVKLDEILADAGKRWGHLHGYTNRGGAIFRPSGNYHRVRGWAAFGRKHAAQIAEADESVLDRYPALRRAVHALRRARHNARLHAANVAGRGLRFDRGAEEILRARQPDGSIVVVACKDARFFRIFRVVKRGTWEKADDRLLSRDFTDLVRLFAHAGLRVTPQGKVLQADGEPLGTRDPAAAGYGAMR